MNDYNHIAEKIDNHIAGQTKSNDRIELALVKLADQMATFMGFQIRAEERHVTQAEFKTEAKKNIADINKEIKSIREDELKPLTLLVQRNTIVASTAIAVSGLVVGGAITWVVM